VEFFRNPNIDFLGKKWYFLAFSLVFSVAGILSMLFWHGIPLGVDFRGGTLVRVKFTQSPDVNEIRALMDRAGLHSARIQRFGPQHPVGFRPVLRNQEHGAVSHAVLRPTDPTKIKFLVGDNETVDRRIQSVEGPDPGFGGEGARYNRLPFGDNSGVFRFDVDKIVGVDRKSGVGRNRAGDR